MCARAAHPPSRAAQRAPARASACPAALHIFPHSSPHPQPPQHIASTTPEILVVM